MADIRAKSGGNSSIGCFHVWIITRGIRFAVLWQSSRRCVRNGIDDHERRAGRGLRARGAERREDGEHQLWTRSWKEEEAASRGAAELACSRLR